MAENKKDSFTFSDKIKNSKPAFNPFSKRVPSKIGSNGKPKKTLFERTRRDAPFFVAAAAALLMLPFLYKYSGSVNEEPIIPPGSEDSIFDPERFGFDPSVEDPNGQIAQLTGRDPLSLIKGWGSDDEEVASDDSLVDYRVQDGLDDNFNVPSASSSPRSYAPAATRAAFQRQATKINELGDASMNLRGGGGTSFRFGGSKLKAAAAENSAGAPKEGIKPVSLQPLRAAGSPSRSYYGQGGAAQARASRDAMTKSNALQALSDAMFTPVRSGRLGGIGTGEFASGGGGATINHTLDYKGITPWWWDMMKERSQEAWRWKYFLWRKNLVEPLVQALANLAVGFGCCLASGSDDCSMGNFFGVRAGHTEAATCCGVKEAEWIGYAGANVPFNEAACKGFKKSHPECSEGWVGGRTEGRDLGFVGVRIDCLSNGIFGSAAKYGSGDPGLELGGTGSCDALNRTHNYSVRPTGQALKWKTYHYIVTRNEIPVVMEGETMRIHICDEWRNDLEWKNKSAAAIGAVADLSEKETQELRDIKAEIEALEEQKAEAEAKGDASTAKNLQSRIDASYDIIEKPATYFTEKKKSENNNNRAHAGGVVSEDLNDACVIYVAEAEVLNWEKSFKPDMIDLLTKLAVDQKLATDEITGNSSISPARKLAEHAFTQMDLAFIESITSKYPVKYDVKDLPMPYWQWFEANIERRGKKQNVNKRKHRLEGIDTVRGARCYFDNSTKIDCVDTLETDGDVAKAIVKIGPSFQGGRVTTGAKAMANIRVTAAYTPYDPNKGSVLAEQTVTGQPSGNIINYVYDRILAGGVKGSVAGPGTVQWNLYRSGELIQTATCEFKNEGTQGITPEPVEPRSLPLAQAATVTEYVDKQMDAAVLATSVAEIPTDPTKHALLTVGGKTNPATGTMLYSQFKTNDLDAFNNAVLASDEARMFINQVVDGYNSKVRPEGQPYLTALASGNPRLSEFVDALYMAKNSLGMTEVPRPAVCEMGRAIALRSRDMSNGGARAQGLTNTFGTFAIYVGLDSVYYPNQKVEVNGDTMKDVRFAQDPYYWGNYSDLKTSSLRGIYPSVKEAISMAQVNGRFPLASLTAGQIQPLPTQGISKEVGYYRDEYAKSYGEILFKGFGKCDQLTGNMPIQDALDYMQRVIELGLEYKPQAVTSSGQGKSSARYTGQQRGGEINR